MKKIFFASILLLLVTIVGYGQTFTVNGINYEVTSSTEVKVITTVTSGDISIPEVVNHNTIDYTVTAIGNTAFQSQFGITSVSLPNTVTAIGDYAFDGCIGLTNLTIGNSVSSIGDYAFQSVIGIDNINLPNSLQTIGDKSFQYCTGLLSIAIPNSVTTIGESAFYGCDAITTIYIGNLATVINEYAFGLAGSSSTLTEVQSAVTSPPNINANVFSNRTLSSCSLIVPPGSETSYQSASVWSTFNPISGTLSTNDYNNLESFLKIYPNPINDIINISGEEILNVEVFTLQGKRLFAPYSNNQINISNFAQGVYILKINSKNGYSSKRIIKN